MDQKPSYESIESENTNLKKQIETLKNAEKVMYTLYDISNAVNTTRNLEELYQSIYDSLNRLMPLPNFYIAIYDNKKKTINFDYFIDEYDNDFPIIDNLEEPGCLTGEVILAGRPLFFKENMLIERDRQHKIVGTIPKIWIGVPLIIQDTVIGAICVQHYSDPEYFSHRHLEILVSVSDQIAVAIERKQILEVLEKKAFEGHLSQYPEIDPIATLAEGIAHDFNNILSGITGYLELLSIDQEALSDIQKNYITNALISSKNAVQLIKQLQALTPPSSSIPSDVDICKIVVEKESDKRNDGISQKKPKTILVIEDEDMVRDMAVKALKAFGYNAFDACNGEVGLDIFKKDHQSIDAVLLDIIMPKMSGTETFKQMLNINPNVKVIVASGHVTNQDQKKIFSKACAYLEKPYQIIELKQILESIFE